MACHRGHMTFHSCVKNDIEVTLSFLKLLCVCVCVCVCVCDRPLWLILPAVKGAIESSGVKRKPGWGEGTPLSSRGPCVSSFLLSATVGLLQGPQTQGLWRCPWVPSRSGCQRWASALLVPPPIPFLGSLERTCVLHDRVTESARRGFLPPRSPHSCCGQLADVLGLGFERRPFSTVCFLPLSANVGCFE
jgi:hypothetical protein